MQGRQEITPRSRAVRNAVTLLEEDYKAVLSAIEKHRSIALDGLRSKLRGEVITLGKGLRRRGKEKCEESEILRRTIDGLNDTLLEQRIKVTELRKKSNGYKRENLSLRNDLTAHMAEVNYLTKIANTPARDPSVVRKIAKLEKQNRELVEKYEKLRLIVVKKESRKTRRDKNRERDCSFKLFKKNLIQTTSNEFPNYRFFKNSKLSSSYEVLVDIRPADFDGAGNCGRARKKKLCFDLQTSASLIPEFHSLWLIGNRLSLTNWNWSLQRDRILNIGEITAATPVNDKVEDEKLQNNSCGKRGSDKTDEDDRTKTVLHNNKIASCLKNNRSSSNYRRTASASVALVVRFDPEVKCCLSDSVDAKISCIKRVEFIQKSADNLLSRRQIKVPLLMQMHNSLHNTLSIYGAAEVGLQNAYDCRV